mmetsp:Transcript_98962/g.300349  ORF Transcript_98962/g.300349 Transcript_98962/m.300349 type:complete len:211 (-) Transcript_98962:524-1156(-)
MALEASRPCPHAWTRFGSGSSRSTSISRSRGRWSSSPSPPTACRPLRFRATRSRRTSRNSGTGCAGSAWSCQCSSSSAFARTTSGRRASTTRSIRTWSCRWTSSTTSSARPRSLPGQATAGSPTRRCSTACGKPALSAGSLTRWTRRPWRRPRPGVSQTCCATRGARWRSAATGTFSGRSSTSRTPRHALSTPSQARCGRPSTPLVSGRP